MSPKHEARLPLAFIPAGSEVRLIALGDEIDPLQREQLTAYGLAESRPIKVLQQRPMTVILAEEVELALEHGVARHIWVERETNEGAAQKNPD
jgi:Fe2+ transport system protein FeoA